MLEIFGAFLLRFYACDCCVIKLQSQKWVQHRFYTVHGSQEEFKYIMKLHGHKWDGRSKVIWKVKVNMVYPMSNRKIFTQFYQGQILVLKV